MNKWISVDERLPDVCGMPVLMVAVNEYGQKHVVKGFTDYACPIDFHTNETEYYGTWHAWKVTHWMPLPEPPKVTDCLTCRYFVECEPDMIAYHNDPCDLYKERKD